MDDSLYGKELSDEIYKEAQALQAWLDSDDRIYLAGLGLLSQHCRNRILLQHLMKKDSQANKEKLAYELEKLLADPTQLKVSEAQPVAVLQTEPVIQVTPPVSEPDIPASVQVVPVVTNEIEQITLLQSALYKEKAELSNKLVAMGESNDEPAVSARLAIIEQMEAIEAEYNQLAEQKVQLAQPGYSPAPEPTEEQKEQTALAQARLDSLKLQRKALAPNLSKARKAAEANPTDTKKAEKLAKLEAEIRELDDQIKLLMEV